MYGIGELGNSSLCVDCLPTTLETPTKIPPQEHHDRFYQWFGFLDDHWLAVRLSGSGSGAPARLLLLDASLEIPTQTWFYGSVFSDWTCVVEAGGYKPSTEDLLTAPFYPDSSQCILALSLGFQGKFFVIEVGTLLRLAREQAGRVIQWEKWRPYLVEAFVGVGRRAQVHHPRYWISGFRLLRLTIAQDGSALDVYDFSARGRMKFLWLEGDGRKVMHPSTTGCCLPCGSSDTYDVGFGHDSLVVWTVSRFSSSLQLRNTPRYSLVPNERIRHRVPHPEPLMPQDHRPASSSAWPELLSFIAFAYFPVRLDCLA
jgi:hypothetical protein